MLDYDCVQLGYSELMKKLHEKGVFIIWVTMRSLPFYEFSKNYIRKYIEVEGILLM